MFYFSHVLDRIFMAKGKNRREKMLLAKASSLYVYCRMRRSYCLGLILSISPYRYTGTRMLIFSFLRFIPRHRVNSSSLKSGGPYVDLSFLFSKSSWSFAPPFGLQVEKNWGWGVSPDLSLLHIQPSHRLSSDIDGLWLTLWVLWRRSL